MMLSRSHGLLVPRNLHPGNIMRSSATLSCSCREVCGVVTDAAPNTVNRVVCYCDDCQAFLHKLDRADLLDDQGGTDVIQLAPACLTFVRASSGCGSHREASTGGMQAAAGCPSATPWLRQFRSSGCSHGHSRAKRRRPISYSVTRLGAFSAGMRSVTHRRDRRGSTHGSWGERSAWSLDGARAGRHGRIPFSIARGEHPTSR